ncbi:hypothetical protein G6F40_015248 [Rhizopus arrhizus]|nr:hypothetical protein G6F40_015248 [Rhizopus arrhizus]
MDALVGKLAVETAPDARKALAAQFARLASTDVPIVPLVEIQSFTLAGKNVRYFTTGANIRHAVAFDLAPPAPGRSAVAGRGGAELRPDPIRARHVPGRHDGRAAGHRPGADRTPARDVWAGPAADRPTAEVHRFGRKPGFRLFVPAQPAGAGRNPGPPAGHARTDAGQHRHRRAGRHGGGHRVRHQGQHLVG